MPAGRPRTRQDVVVGYAAAVVVTTIGFIIIPQVGLRLPAGSVWGYTLLEL